MNRQSAPEIKTITTLKTGFPDPEGKIYKLASEEGVFKLELVFHNSGYGLIDNKFHGIYGLDLLLNGTNEKSAEQIAGEIDALGGYVFKGCDYYTSSITIFGMNENIIKLIDIVKDSLYNCAYDEKELSVYKTRKISELNINLNKTAYLANRSIHHLLTGEKHPYSLSSTEESINSIRSVDLLNFKKASLENPYFIFTGSENTQIANILRNSGFEIKDQSPIAFKNEQSPMDSTGQEGLIEKKGSTQNSIRFGKVLPARSHKDYFTISLFNLILGGYFGSRLMKNIREEKGLTYGIHSSLTPFKTYSLFKISCECNSKLTGTVKDEIGKEIRQLQLQLVDSEEFLIAKNYLLGALSRNFDGAFNISERLKSFLDLDSPMEYYQEYFAAINSINPQDIMNCANNYFDINSLKYCVAGEI